MSKSSVTKTDKEKVIEIYSAQLTRSQDIFTSIYNRCSEENDFSMGNMWDSATEKSRNIPGQERPCITVNKIDPIIRKIVNNAREQELEAIVKGLDNQSDKDTATILTGFLNRIQYKSNAKEAFMWAYECAVRSGIGYFRVMNEYESENSFDQTIVYRSIRNPFTVWYDPDSEDYAGRDARFAIIEQEISEFDAKNLCASVGEEYKDEDPEDDIWSSTSGFVKQSEMYWMEMEDDVLYQFADKSTAKESDLSPEIKKEIEQVPGLVLRKRDIKVPVVWYANIVNSVVIEKIRTNSRYIPVVRMVGRVGYINGKVDYRGITRNSMDANRMYNVMSSLLVEKIGLASRAPYIGAAGQFEGYEEQWLNANNENLSKLEYNPISLAGVVIPPPQQTGSVQGDPTIERYLALTDKDIKDTSSMSDAFMGNKSNETSGAGIKARAAQSSMSTLDLLQQCQSSIRFGAEIVLDMAPKILSERTAIAIMGPDYEEKVINLKAFMTDDGEVKEIDFNKGTYGVEIDVASGDKTRRETALEQMAFLLQTNPEAGSLVMDIFVSNLDIKDADKVAKRFKAMLPPKAIAAEQEGSEISQATKAVHDEAAAIITKLKQQFDECKAELNDATEKLKQKDGELAIKSGDLQLQSRELDLKEIEVRAKIKYDEKKLELEEEKIESDSKAETKPESKGKEDTIVDDDGEEHDISVAAQLPLLLRKVKGQDEELDMLSQQMKLVVEVLNQLKGNNSNEQAGPTQQPDEMTTGNSPPPVEAENNIGET